jgi:type VI protein secretion system component Hcp
MTDERMEGQDERELAEDLEPTDEAAGDVTGGDKSAATVSEFTIQKKVDKATPELWK